MGQKELFDELCHAIVNYDEEAARQTAIRAVEAKADLIEGLKLMSGVLRDIGEKFQSGELFLPHMVMASDAMLA